MQSLTDQYLTTKFRRFLVWAAVTLLVAWIASKLSDKLFDVAA